ncbi:MAG: hypothetical protein HYW06_10010 [Gemmatimonadetes bacterium]|nr:hypothetical protein [Gemmatimonadota bacterium]
MSPDQREKTPRGPAAESAGGLGAYLTIAGRGLPAGSLFDAKVSALYSVAYAIKLGMGRGGRDFTVVDLEAFWVRPPDGPRIWKLGIRAPAALSPRDLSDAIATLAAKGKDPLVKDVLLESLQQREVERFPLVVGVAAATSP